jgi:hypothetical protein
MDFVSVVPDGSFSAMMTEAAPAVRVSREFDEILRGPA